MQMGCVFVSSTHDTPLKIYLDAEGEIVIRRPKGWIS
jgi:hypothetical protein